MRFGGLHVLDFAVVAGYFVAVTVIGRIAATSSKTREGFYLADRKLGRIYQFILSFGHSTEPQGAVSIASFVYQQGASGSWLSLQMVFMNPYFWFMRIWFRRVRLVTMADLFEDRFKSQKLGVFYTLFQVAVVCVSIGFSNVVAYRIAAPLMSKPESAWSPAERTSIESMNALRELEHTSQARPLTPAESASLAGLRERNARGELSTYASYLNQSSFYLCFAVVTGAYIILGGMASTAANQALQGILTILFSVMLIPIGIHAIGGWHVLHQRIPQRMFDLLGSSGSDQFTGWSLIAILLVSIIQVHGLCHNMGVNGSAKNEMAARFFVAGTYLKRVVTIAWAFVGLVAIAVFGVNGLSNPDNTWGEMSKHLLSPGLIGLMLAGVLAGTMANVSVKALALSSLFICNLFRKLGSSVSERRSAFYSRVAVGGIFFLGAGTAWLLGDFLSVANLVLTVDLPFGAAILLIFLWRRLTAKAVWWAVGVSVLVILVIPWTLPGIPAIRTSPSLTVTSPAPGGTLASVYFGSVVHESPSDSESPLSGRGRFNFECWILAHAGIDVAAMTPLERFTAQFFFDGIFPFVLLFGVSLLTRENDVENVERFYGKMKTPVGETPEAEAAALALTKENPKRFDTTKLFPNSQWEFCKWNRVDTIGFIACCAASFAVLGLFRGLLALAR